MSDDPGPRIPLSASPSGDRLESWKEIAGYLGKDVRTVQRWEKRAGLPVHRHREARILNVQASRIELDAWRNGGCRLASGQGTEEPPIVPGLMILPFRMLRPDPEIAFLAHSLPDAITHALAGLQSVVVRSRLVAGAHAAAALDLKALAVTAGVHMVLVGTLLRVTDRVRVHAQLLEVPAGTILCSHSTDVTLQDLFLVEDELTQRIVASLPWRVTRDEQDRLGRDRPASAAAYEYFLRANQLAERIDRWLTARDLYLRALEQDPGYAPAWARLGRIYRITAKMFELHDPEAHADSLRRAESALARALELNPDLAMAHTFSAALEIERGGARKAMARLLERARTRPVDPDVCAGLVAACRYGGLLPASLAAHRQAERLDPAVSTSVRYTLWQSGEYEAAIEGGAGAYDAPLRAMCLLQLGRDAEAVAVLEAGRAELETSPLMRAIVGLLLGIAGGLQAHALAERVRHCHDVLAPIEFDPEALFGVGLICARAGDADRAMHLLERAVTNGFACHVPLRRESWLGPLRARPDFERLSRLAAREHEACRDAYHRAEGERVLGVPA